MNERGAHFWPTAMFTGGVFGSQQLQHSQQPCSGQYSQQPDVGPQQLAVPAAVGSSFLGQQYSEQPCFGPTAVTAPAASNSLFGQHHPQQQPYSGQQPTVVTAAVAYSFGLGQQPLSCDGELHKQTAGFGQPTGVTAAAAGGSSFFGLQHSEQPCYGQQPMVVTAAEVGSYPEQRLQQRVAHLGQPPLHEQRAYDGYDSDGLQQLDLGTHARMPQKGALATKRQKRCVCGVWLYCVCGGYGSGPSGSELDSDDGSGDDDSDSDLDPRSSDGSSKRLKPTHPQPTEVSECLCPASHRREYYSDDFAGGGGYCREGTVGQAVRRA